MVHDHHHGQAHAAATHDRAFAIGIALNLAYVVVEAGFGLIAGSLALLADAGHNLSDVLGLALAWGAAWLSRRQPTARRTYGFRRSSILPMHRRSWRISVFASPASIASFARRTNCSATSRS